MKKKLISIGALMLVLALILTLMPSCGNGDEKATPTPGPGYTPTPGVTPTPTGEVKTIKIGAIAPLSGVGATWGIPVETGVKWAADRINEAGGFKVGADTYMIEIVMCDNKLIASATGECGQKLAYDEGIHYVVGPIGYVETVRFLFNEAKVFSTQFGVTASPMTTEYPYEFNCVPLGPDCVWSLDFNRMVLEMHPEIKTIALITGMTSCDNFHVCEQQVAEALGWEVVAENCYQFGTTDFYPFLTKFLAENPDAIGFENSAPGDIALLIKQARELGYTGLLFAANSVLPEFLVETAGVESAEGFLNNWPDYTTDFYPETTQALAEDYLRRYPGVPMYTTSLMSFVTVNFFVRGMEVAGTTDSEAVQAVFDDPNFTFEFFGFPDAKLGGIETYGRPSCFPYAQAISTFENGGIRQLNLAWTESP